jgi:hypothetical protein
VSIAWSSPSHSTRWKPSSCSLVSANGPSITTVWRPLRRVTAAVVGNSLADGPIRPAAASPCSTPESLAITAPSSAMVHEPTTSSRL